MPAPALSAPIREQPALGDRWRKPLGANHAPLGTFTPQQANQPARPLTHGQQLQTAVQARAAALSKTEFGLQTFPDLSWNAEQTATPFQTDSVTDSQSPNLQKQADLTAEATATAQSETVSCDLNSTVAPPANTPESDQPTTAEAYQVNDSASVQDKTSPDIQPSAQPVPEATSPEPSITHAERSFDEESNNNAEPPKQSALPEIQTKPDSAHSQSTPSSEIETVLDHSVHELGNASKPETLPNQELNTSATSSTTSKDPALDELSANSSPTVQRQVESHSPTSTVDAFESPATDPGLSPANRSKPISTDETRPAAETHLATHSPADVSLKPDTEPTAPSSDHRDEHSSALASPQPAETTLETTAPTVQKATEPSVSDQSSLSPDGTDTEQPEQSTLSTESAESPPAANAPPANHDFTTHPDPVIQPRNRDRTFPAANPTETVIDQSITQLSTSPSASSAITESLDSSPTENSAQPTIQRSVQPSTALEAANAMTSPSEPSEPSEAELTQPVQNSSTSTFTNQVSTTETAQPPNVQPRLDQVSSKPLIQSATNPPSETVTQPSSSPLPSDSSSSISPINTSQNTSSPAASTAVPSVQTAPESWNNLDELVGAPSQTQSEPWADQFDLQAPVAENLTSPFISLTALQPTDSSANLSAATTAATTTTTAIDTASSSSVAQPSTKQKAPEPAVLEALAQTTLRWICNDLWLSQIYQSGRADYPPPWFSQAILPPNQPRSQPASNQNPDLTKYLQSLTYPNDPHLYALAQELKQRIKLRLICDCDRTHLTHTR